MDLNAGPVRFISWRGNRFVSGANEAHNGRALDAWGPGLLHCVGSTSEIVRINIVVNSNSTRQWVFTLATVVPGVLEPTT